MKTNDTQRNGRPQRGRARDKGKGRGRGASNEKSRSFDIGSWTPKTEIGRKVKNGDIKDIDTIIDHGGKILESEIVDVLIPDNETYLLLIGQSRGKFGGGQRRIFKQTQKKTKEGNKPQFSTMAVVGNKNGYVGLGSGKAKETVPARDNAIRSAKLNVFKIRRGCGSWQCNCDEPHTIPFAVTGKCGSVELTLMPAPRGKGLCAHSECQHILRLAGIKDVWAKTRGSTGTRTNLVKACILALRKLMETKIPAANLEKFKVVEGKYAAIKNDRDVSFGTELPEEAEIAEIAEIAESES